jgi:ABC-type bacteriocin/lantibiotic exporter with double-glycine peptidase domain
MAKVSALANMIWCNCVPPVGETVHHLQARLFVTCRWEHKTNNNQQTTNRKQQTTNSKQQTPTGLRGVQSVLVVGFGLPRVRHKECLAWVLQLLLCLGC